ncbi:hypothetical protein ACS5NO_27970 [Larkinella sp. GY13]|jgi:hypothetical protein|uniref:hypothetical protein n=1 Tax=Larkinella sp. GY13 TaxID=3453720 RepID=UPI003EEEE8F8
MNLLLKVSSACILLLLTGCGNFIRYVQQNKAVRSGFVRQHNFVTAIPFKKEIIDKYIVELTINASPKKYRFILDSGVLMRSSQKAFRSKIEDRTLICWFFLPLSNLIWR